MIIWLLAALIFISVPLGLAILFYLAVEQIMADVDGEVR